MTGANALTFRSPRHPRSADFPSLRVHGTFQSRVQPWRLAHCPNPRTGTQIFPSFSVTELKNWIELGRGVPHNLLMLAKVCSTAVNGIEAYPIEVEVNAGWGDTKIIIVGLPDAAVRESQDRVSTTLGNSAIGLSPNAAVAH